MVRTESQTWTSQGTAAGDAAVAKAGGPRKLVAAYPLVASVKAALAAVYDDPAWPAWCRRSWRSRSIRRERSCERSTNVAVGFDRPVGWGHR